MTIEVFRCPRFQIGENRQFEIQFTGVCPAGSGLTLVSNKIGFKFRVIQVKMFFLDEANNWIRHRWYASSSPFAPSTAPPPDTNIFSTESGDVEFIGKGIIRVAACNFETLNVGMYIKLYTDSDSPYDYSVNGSCVIEEI
jgi:hypothetical protein